MEPSPTLGYVAFYALLVFGLAAVMLGLSWVLGERTRYTKATLEPYESGIVHTGSARFRTAAKFYLVAIMFVIFDLEVVYLLTWGLVAREVGWIGYIEVMVFIGILLLALIYLIRVGALEWAPQHQKKSDRRY